MQHEMVMLVQRLSQQVFISGEHLDLQLQLLHVANQHLNLRALLRFELRVDLTLQPHLVAPRARVGEVVQRVAFDLVLPAKCTQRHGPAVFGRLQSRNLVHGRGLLFESRVILRWAQRRSRPLGRIFSSHQFPFVGHRGGRGQHARGRFG